MRIVRYTSLFRKKYFFERWSNYRPPMKLREGNVLTGVCHYVWGDVHVWSQIPSGDGYAWSNAPSWGVHVWSHVPCPLSLPGGVHAWSQVPPDRHVQGTGYNRGWMCQREMGSGILEGWGSYTRGVGIPEGV